MLHQLVSADQCKGKKHQCQVASQKKKKHWSKYFPFRGYILGEERRHVAGEKWDSVRTVVGSRRLNYVHRSRNRNNEMPIIWIGLAMTRTTTIDAADLKDAIIFTGPGTETKGGHNLG